MRFHGLGRVVGTPLGRVEYMRNAMLDLLERTPPIYSALESALFCGKEYVAHAGYRSGTTGARS